MHLFFRNIVVYNGAASEFGKLSNKVEKCFEDHWAASGLAGGSRQGTSVSASIQFGATEAAKISLGLLLRPQKLPKQDTTTASCHHTGAHSAYPASW